MVVIKKDWILGDVIGIGCCKLLVVCVCICEGFGKILINNCLIEEYFFCEKDCKLILEMFDVVE